MTHVHRRSAGGPKTLWGLTVTRALGLMLVPALIAGIFLWGLWDPTTRLNAVTAAVVNNDEPVEVDGRLTPLGRVLAGELIGTTESENFAWELTNDERAAEGLASGEYVTVVTIPEEFSAAATSLGDGPDDARQATITIETSERAKLLDAALSQAVTQTAARVLNTQLGEAFVGNIFVAFAELGEGIGEASEGASQLAAGAHELAGGADELSTGTEQLAEGMGDLAQGAGGLAAGAGELSSGLEEFAAGTRELEGGVHTLSGGTSQLARGLGEYAAGVQELADGTREAAGGSAQLAEGVDEYVGEVNDVLKPVLGRLTEAAPRIRELRDAIESGELPVPEELRQRLIEIIDEVLAAPPLLELAVTGGENLVQGAYASAHGMVDLADGAEDLAGGASGLARGAQELASGAGQLAAEMPQLVSGAEQLARGAGDVTAGATQLAHGGAALADGAGELAAGTAELADGAHQAASGSSELAAGLAEAAAEIPQYSDSERERLAELAVNPIAAESDDASLFSGTGAPLFLSIALWAGALAVFMLLTPLWSRTREAAMSEASITLRSAASGMLVGGVQGLIAALLVALVLNASATHTLAYLATGLVTGVSFALMNQGLVALFKGYGRFAAFVVLVTAFVGGIVSTVPGVFATLTGFTPVGSAVEAFQRIAESGTPGLGATLMLIVWAALGFIILGAAVHRERQPGNP